MWAYFPLVIITLCVIFFIILLIPLYFKKSGGEQKRKLGIKYKDRNKIIREANKRLSQYPKDTDALLALADLYYKENIFDKAQTYYNSLIELCATNPNLNEFEITVRSGLCSLKMGNIEEAYKSLIIARSMEEENFELCYHLGYLEYMKKAYDKALMLFKKAQSLNPEHVQTIRYLGHSYFKNKQYLEASEELIKAIEFEPNDKESLFALAQCHYELTHTDRALNIFSHLRLDPKLGPAAALFAGTIHLNNHNYSKAIMDLEIGLKHNVIRSEIKLELKYRLAAAYLKEAEMDRALTLLEEIKNDNPDYKDVVQQYTHYRELTSNKDLQIFLMASNPEFLALCRKIATLFFENAKVKIISISLNKSEFADILAEVHTKRWEDIVLFRFIRTTGNIGELIVRDLYASCKEHKADRGFCISAGDYSDTARQFVEARLIDLIDKDGIKKLFKRIGIIHNE